MCRRLYVALIYVHIDNSNHHNAAVAHLNSVLLLKEEDCVCSHDTGDRKVQVLSRSSGSLMFPSRSVISRTEDDCSATIG